MLNNEQFAAAQKAQLATLLGPRRHRPGRRREAGRPQPRDRASPRWLDADAQAQSRWRQDVQSLLALLQAELLQPAPEKVGAYGRKLYDIVTGVQAELSKFAEVAPPTRRRSSPRWSNPPPRTRRLVPEQAVAMAKAAFAAANDAFGNAQKAAKQAAEAAEANIVKFSAATKPAAKSRAPPEAHPTTELPWLPSRPP